MRAVMLAATALAVGLSAGGTGGELDASGVAAVGGGAGAGVGADRAVGGRLRVVDGTRAVDLPLEHTRARIRVDGYLAEAQVTQVFHNPYDHPIEAVYLFPLPDQAAVHDMTISHGGRTVRGTIRRREEARLVYERARARGQLAALLDQERPNLFRQQVANIAPGERIEVSLRYVEPLRYEAGGYELVFPMVAPPRHQPTSAAPAGTRAADGEAVQPPVLPPDLRSRHDIDLAVEIDAGVPIRGLASPSHRIETSRGSEPARAAASLHPSDTIPNKDFILRYQVAGDAPALAVLADRAGPRGGSFFLLAQPPRDPADDEVAAREIVFVLDTSSSMAGAPLAKSKELVRRILTALRPDDTFQIVRFADAASSLGPRPIANRPRNRELTLAWLEALTAGGGTAVTAGIDAALEVPHDPGRLRLIVFLTDGYVGDEDRILAGVRGRMGEARLFSFGVGSAVNRYLLDEMALAGRGAAQFVRPDEETAAVVDRFARRIDKAALTDIEIDWNGLAVEELAPAAVPDLFVGQPLVVAGRYRAPGKAVVTVRGRQAGRPVTFTIPVVLPAEAARPSVATVWARRRIAELDRRLIRSEDAGAVAEVTRLGLEHRLVTAYTSFVAVDESQQLKGQAVRIVVPVEVPEGVAHAVGHGGWGFSSAGYGSGGGGYGTIGTGRYGVIGHGVGGGVVGFSSGASAAEAGVLGVISSGGAAGGALAGRSVSAPRVTIGSAVSTGDLDRNLIRRYVRRKLPAIRHCYEKALVRQHDLTGTVTSSFTIDVDGRVTESTADGIGDPVLESCVAEAIGAIEFPEARGGGLVKVRYPFHFKRAE